MLSIRLAAGVGPTGPGSDSTIASASTLIKKTALPISCPPRTHYVDLANELFAITALLGLHDEAVAAGRLLITMAGVLCASSVTTASDRAPPGPATRASLPAVQRSRDRLGPSLPGSRSRSSMHAAGRADGLVEVVTLVEIVDEPGMRGMPSQQLAGQRAGGRAVGRQEA